MKFKVSFQNGVMYVNAVNRDDAEEWSELQYGRANGPYDGELCPDDEKPMLSVKVHETDAFKKSIKDAIEQQKIIDAAPTWEDLAKLGVTYELVDEPAGQTGRHLGINVRRQVGKTITCLRKDGRFVDHTEDYTIKGATDADAQKRAQLLAQQALERYHLDHWSSVRGTYDTVMSFMEFCQSKKLEVTFLDENECVVYPQKLLLEWLEVDSSGLEEQRRMLLEKQRELYAKK